MTRRRALPQQVSEPRNSTRLLRFLRNKTSVTVSQRTESSAPPVLRRVGRIGPSCTRMSTRRSSCNPTIDREQGDDQRGFYLAERCDDWQGTTGGIPLAGNDYRIQRTDEAGSNENRHGGTIACTLKESCTKQRHYTFVVAPGHRGFIQDTTTGALQADMGHILVEDRQPNHLDACTQNSSPISCHVHTKRGIC